jgi:hypothetical protein
MRFTLFLLAAGILQTGCSPRDQAQTRHDAQEFQQDVKRGYRRADRAVTKGLEQVKRDAAPAAKEFGQSVKRGYQRTEKAFQKGMEPARDPNQR